MNPRSILLHANLANQLTFLRLVAVPFFVLSILESRFTLALLLFAGATVTDALDGLTARLMKQRTPLGALLDPAADKLLLTSAFVLLTDYPSMLKDVELIQRIPLWLTILTISRDVLIVCIALLLYVVYDRTSFRPSILGKLTAVSEFATVSLFLLASTLGRSSVALDAMVFVTLGFTLVSGFHYLNRTVRWLASGDAAPTKGAGKGEDRS